MNDSGTRIWLSFLGAEIARDYKPKPAVYVSAAATLDCAPAEVVINRGNALVDLAAAATAVQRRNVDVRRPASKWQMA